MFKEKEKWGEKKNLNLIPQTYPKFFLRFGIPKNKNIPKKKIAKLAKPLKLAHLNFKGWQKVN